MALKATVKQEDGSKKTGVILRVEGVVAEMHTLTRFVLSQYDSEQDTTPSAQGIFRFERELTDENLEAQAYAHLKTLPAFEGAVEI